MIDRPEPVDWTDAFDNSSYVPGSDALAGLWSEMAAAWRAAMDRDGKARLDLVYGPGPRERFDLFLPEGEARGLVVFVHGGYWQWMDKSAFSHLAAGPRRHGWAVALPSYPQAPEVRISAITKSVAFAISAAAAEEQGPIRIAGHSAGGHLVARMACEDSLLPAPVAARIERAMSISGIHDLRPMLHSAMNQTLGLDAAEAEAESPVLLKPRTGLSIHAVVGAAERPELMRQTRLLAEAWNHVGADVADAYLAGEDHFSIIEALADPESGLVNRLLG
jgi:acetyl esterase/lipase